MARQLRIWWPKQHLLTKPLQSDFLFGWFVSSSLASLDIVVALTVKETLLPCSSLDLEVKSCLDLFDYLLEVTVFELFSYFFWLNFISVSSKYIQKDMFEDEKYV